MKALVLFRLAPTADRNAVAAHLDDEVTALWRLYTASTLTEVYLTEDPGVVVAVADGDDLDHIRGFLDELPLVAAGHLSVELHSLLPFRNWQRLFARELDD